MAFFSLESEILPDDRAALPPAGSEAQRRMIAQEEALGSDYEEYNKRLDSVSEAQLSTILDGCADVARELLHLGKGPRQELRALDIGTGAGATAVRVLERVPGISEMCLHDISPLLLQRTSDYIHGRFPKTQVTTANFDLLEKKLTEHFAPGSFDLVFSTNCFQHFRREHQAELMDHAFQLLAPGGAFVLLTHLKLVSRDWKEEIVRQIVAHATLTFSNHSPEAVREIIRSHVMNEHEHLTVPFAFDSLRRAGFRFYECTYRNFIYGVFVAIR